MAVDANAMPPVYLQTIREGDLGEQISLAETTGTPTVGGDNARQGKVLYHPVSVTLPKPLTQGGKMGLPPKTEGQALEDDLGEADFLALAYEGTASIPEERQMDGAAYGEDTLGHFILRAHALANMKEDYDWALGLASTSLNQVHAIGTSWAGGGGSPLDDIKEIIRTKVPGADRMYIARDVADTLSLHDEMIGQIVNFSGGGGLTDDQLAAVLTGHFKLEVIIISKNYNSTARGSGTLARTYLFAGKVWIGHKDAVLYHKPSLALQSATGAPVSNDALRVWSLDGKRTDCIQWLKYSDPIIIPDSSLTCTITGAIA